MKRGLIHLLTLAVILTVGLMACDGGGLGANTVTVDIVYGSEKQAWLEPLVQEYNAAQHETAEGMTILVEATPMGSIEAIDAILAEQIQPTVWSPASSVYLPVANERWRQKYAADITAGTPNDLVLSPVVIAMWRPMAQALGWPEEPIGWSDISELAISEEGWAEFGFPEWGRFKFGHTHPGFSNSGLVSVIAEAYAGAGKQRDLTVADVNDPAVVDFMSQVESSIIHYGSSTGFFAERMFERGPSYLSAAVMYENLIVDQERQRLAGQSNQLPVAAIYPKEGTFWTNNPYIILDGPWVTEAQTEAAQAFEAFLLAEPQQRQAMEFGFRPADPAISLADPLNIDHGVDPGQPQTILETPSAAVIQEISDLWGEVKRPVDLVLVVDASGSMSGDKIAAVRQSLDQFIDLLHANDRLQLITFDSEVHTLVPLSPVGDKKEELKQRVSGLIEGGDTSLYDAILTAHQALQANADSDHIRAMVVLSDGDDTSSRQTLQDVTAQTGSVGEEGGNAIKIFTIAYGGGADVDVLQQIAEPTGAKQFSGDPRSINAVYQEIALFF